MDVFKEILGMVSAALLPTLTLLVHNHELSPTTAAYIGSLYAAVVAPQHIQSLVVKYNASRTAKKSESVQRSGTESSSETNLRTG